MWFCRRLVTQCVVELIVKLKIVIAVAKICETLHMRLGIKNK